MKRSLDILISLFVLLVFLPFGIVISFLIILESRGGVFYIQERIGLNGNPFGLLKFRSMRPNADQLGQLTVGERDPRVTNMGQSIRKYKLDEFPQFINVLKGDMSIIGPRPEVKKYVDLYTDEQRAILSVKPGITDYASLEYFNENELLAQSNNPQETYITEVMPAKLLLNEKYLNKYKSGRISRILLARLDENSKISSHNDSGKHLNYCRRTHIPIVTNDDVEFYVNNQKYSFKENMVYEFDNTKEHAVHNNSEHKRIHMIVDWSY
jgi:lipopolysaccharide/colanic/teichoic acid biosynthesis glycosyltransferase